MVSLYYELLSASSYNMTVMQTVKGTGLVDQQQFYIRFLLAFPQFFELISVILKINWICKAFITESDAGLWLWTKNLA